MNLIYAGLIVFLMTILIGGFILSFTEKEDNQK